MRKYILVPFVALLLAASGWAGEVQLGSEGFDKRVTAQFDKVANTTLGTVTGLSGPVEVGTYKIYAYLEVSPSAAGGSKIQVAGTATASSARYRVMVQNTADSSITVNAVETALAQTNEPAVGATGEVIAIRGEVVVSVAGTLTIEYAQSVASGTSSVLSGNFVAKRIR